MKPLLVANWKIQLSDAVARATAEQLVAGGAPAGIDAVLCPSFTALPAVAAVVRGSAFALGAQDCAREERGAFTGEVSAADLAELECQYVIVGHSERRRHSGETDAMAAAKLRVALRVGLIPILCIGETLEERTSGQLHVVLSEQLRGTLGNLTLVGTQRCCIAYEPVWAVGTGQAAKPEDTAQALGYILELIRERFGEEGIRVLYGGSVSSENIASFLAQPNIHGVLVGAASQSAEGLRRLIAAAQGK